ncbi:MAG: hypothetical protein KGI38_03100 [Thaumarchaeota archaeon]|nr:hypothetical protein [Nitrososphaerota archaeon]
MTKAEFRKFGDMVGFYAPKDKLPHVLAMFKTVGFHVHTLEEHVDCLALRYSGQSEDFGELRFVQLPAGEGWQVYDPDSRDFVYLPTFQSSQGLGANVKEKSVLRCLVGGVTFFFRFSGSTPEGHQLIHRVDMWAANNLVVPFLRSLPAYWVHHPELGLGVVPSWQLAYLPNEVFDAMKRLNPLPKSMDGLYIFDENDSETVKRLLAYVRVELKPSLEAVQLPFQRDKLHGSPVMPLSDVPAGKLDAFVQALCGIAQATSDRDERSVRISSNRATMPIYFVYGEHGSGVDGKLYVAIPNITSPEKAAFMLQQLAPQLGSQVSDGDVRRRLACLWPTEEPGDAAFCLTVFIENFEKSDFARAFLAGQKHADLVKDWYKEATSKKDLGADLMNKARLIGKHLEAMLQ